MKKKFSVMVPEEYRKKFKDLAKQQEMSLCVLFTKLIDLFERIKKENE